MSPVDDYLAKLEAPQKAAFQKICLAVRNIVPDAEETISYGMPAFKYKTKYLLGFFAYKDHLSIFPTPGPITALQDKLTDFTTAKGTIQFTVDKPIPESLIIEIVRHRIAEITR